jgi:hypothetical protein
MHLEKLLRQADEAKMRLELARARLERTAHRWADRHAPRSMRDLHVAAEEFDEAERAVEGAVRTWARALRSRRPSPALVPSEP